MKKKNWEQLKILKNAKRTERVYIITLNNELYYTDDFNLVVFNNEKFAYDYIVRQDYKLGEWNYITKWLNNVEVW